MALAPLNQVCKSLCNSRAQRNTLPSATRGCLCRNRKCSERQRKLGDFKPFYRRCALEGAAARAGTCPAQAVFLRLSVHERTNVAPARRWLRLLELVSDAAADVTGLGHTDPAGAQEATSSVGQFSESLLAIVTAKVTQAPPSDLPYGYEVTIDDARARCRSSSMLEQESTWRLVFEALHQALSPGARRVRKGTRARAATMLRARSCRALKPATQSPMMSKCQPLICESGWSRTSLPPTQPTTVLRLPTETPPLGAVIVAGSDPTPALIVTALLALLLLV